MTSPAPSEYFRAGAGMVVTDGAGNVLAFERSDGRGRWQLPQGGIETGEAPVDAAYRELHEETGFGRDDVELVGELSEWLLYELPSELRSAKTGRGQAQKWFIFRLRDPHVEPTLGGGQRSAPEFKGWKWIAIADLVEQAVGFRQGVYARLREALAAHQ